MPDITNKYGVKIGDLFVASWGYEQTRVSFFQVLSLHGKSSVRVRHVCPPIISIDAISSASENRTYQTKNLPILPAEGTSVFIKDQQRGDLKRLTSFTDDNTPTIRLDDCTYADLCAKDTETCYISWY